VKPGDKVGRYELEELLGEGAMAHVFAARQPLRERRLALKILKREARGDAQYVTRFLGDARAADALDHPSIVRVVDVDIDEASGAPFIVMELVEGPSLDQILAERGRLEVHEAARIAREVALGLGAAHTAGIVHRDVKPSNVLIDRRAGAAKLTDFGAAKHATPGSPSLSFHGQIIGTPRYMAPEQIEGAGPVDARADLFSLGATLYEMLTGAPAFPGEGLATTLNAVLHSAPVPVRQLRPEVPPGLAGLVDRLLAKAPDGRPATAAEVALALVPFAALPASGGEASLPPQEARRSPSPSPDAEVSPNQEETTGRTKGRRDMKRLSTLVIGGVVLAAAALGLWFLGSTDDPVIAPGEQGADGGTAVAPPTTPVPPTPPVPPVASTPVTPPPTPPATAGPQEPAVTPPPTTVPPVDTTTTTQPSPPPPAPEPDLAAVQAALASVPCSTVEAALGPGSQVRLTGTAAHQELVTEARDKVAAVANVAGVDEGGVTVAAAPGCYGAVRLERAVAAAGGAASMPEPGLNKPDGIYLDQDFLVMEAAMPPGLGGHLYVDVLTTPARSTTCCPRSSRPTTRSRRAGGSGSASRRPSGARACATGRRRRRSARPTWWRSRASGPCSQPPRGGGAAGGLRRPPAQVAGRHAGCQGRARPASRVPPAALSTARQRTTPQARLLV
jgi:serine/threonine-protein kinase